MLRDHLLSCIKLCVRVGAIQRMLSYLVQMTLHGVYGGDAHLTGLARS